MIKLLPRKKFEIVLEDNTVIEGQFGTYALALYQARQEKNLDLGNTNVSAITTILLCAVEQASRGRGEKNFSYTDFDACMWIDEMGGMDGEDSAALFAHLTEKKSQVTEPASPLALQTSSESQPAQA